MTPPLSSPPVESLPQRGATLASFILRRALESASDALRLPSDAILARIGVPRERLDDPEGRVSVDEWRAFWREIVQSTDDPYVGLHLGEAIPKGALDVVDYAASSSPTLGEALERIRRYYAIVDDVAEVQIERAEGCVIVRQRHTRVPPVSSHASEGWAALMVARGRVLAGIDWAPCEIRFPHAAPVAITEHARIFRAPIRFDCRDTEIVIAASTYDLPVVTADPALSAMIDRYADARLAKVPSNVDLVDRVRMLIANALCGGDPSLRAISALLHVHGRTLQRRLRGAGTSHEAVLDALRREHAQQYLARADISVGEVAYLLGYSAPRAFHRAFRRWAGQTPHEYRQTLG
jgi:AraC-like DNA-binding protein